MAKGDIKAGKGALVGGAGEYLVVGELLRRGWLAALTPRGMKNFDVFATKDGRTIYVRVKTKTADANMFRWNRPKGAHMVLESTGSNDFCVLVDLASDSPEYYVMTTVEVESALQELQEAWFNGKPGRDPENSMFTIRIDHQADYLARFKSWAVLDA